MADEEILFDDVYDLCEEIGRYVLNDVFYNRNNVASALINQIIIGSFIKEHKQIR